MGSAVSLLCRKRKRRQQVEVVAINVDVPSDDVRGITPTKEELVEKVSVDRALAGETSLKSVPSNKQVSEDSKTEKAASPTEEHKETPSPCQETEEHKQASSPFLETEEVDRTYCYGAVLGRGAFGTVYAAVRKFDHLPVALKTIPDKNVKDWGTIDGYKVPLEICLLKQIQDVPGVIKMLAFFKRSGSFTMVLERPEEAQNLHQYMTKRGVLSEDKAREFFHKILITVYKIQEAGVFHRDLKAENILIDKHDNVHIIDFGSGDFLKRGFYYTYHSTRLHCPPEWLEQKRYRARPATVWSLGILLYFMICGEIPFSKLEQISEGKLVFNRKLSFELRHLIQQCLVISPPMRPTIHEIFKHPWMTMEISTKYE